MKRKLILYLGTIVAAIIVSLWITSCEEEGENTIELGVPFEITEGQSKHLLDSSGFSIVFQEVKENSLCPQDLVCIRQGNFTMSLQFASSSSELSIGDLGLPSTDTVHGYKIQLEAIIYPVNSDDKVDATHPNTVTLLIEKI
ncbi:hypothetical protein [Reichenbachiella ulvae]|uniref:Lipoprotein n=1 Tax=Reichenbachiella ulvae TaxID=2980104 RepID=A0ABT3CXT6_9BACT|nr:hypothetical protein [Reichenbachiella ulvae]MCV9388018.1 hypothetical protein [Reichenbachiella ulvae]